jgi:tRNA G18 (ribose-2'-O)-methylase SpoU
MTLAKTLREEGFWVIVTGPDGETIDETEDEPKPG